jgi:CheY-like chemotaxis protein
MQKGNVLLVDDDPVLLRLLQMMLEDEEYHVHTALGDSALSAARTLRPDVILLDVRMPGIGGVGISHLLRNHVQTRHIPIVVMTSDLARAIREGMIADEWLAKPLDIERLYEGVARWVGRTASMTQLTPVAQL